MKKVKIEIEVDDEINWIATDLDGRIYGYESRPLMYSDYWSSKGEYKFICSLCPNKNWKNSLTKVK